jgi:hypothetical protein
LSIYEAPAVDNRTGWYFVRESEKDGTFNIEDKLITLCDFKDALGYVGAGGALLAAGFWFYASWVGWFAFTETPMILVNRYSRL